MKPADVRLLSWPTLAIAGIVLTALQVVALDVVFPSGALTRLAAATGGFVRPTLVANLAISAVVIGIVLVGFGGQRAKDLGWSGNLRGAMLATLVTWLLLNAMEAIDASRAGAVVADPRWATRPAPLVGQWVAVTFGTALLEETLFRGVVLRQFLARLYVAGMRPRASLLTALVVSQALFAAMHLPILLATGVASWAPLAGLFVAGCALAVLYLATRNLFLCIGVHGLADAPTLIVVDRWRLLDRQTFVVATSLGLALVAFLVARSRSTSSIGCFATIRRAALPPRRGPRPGDRRG